MNVARAAKRFIAATKSLEEATDILMPCAKQQAEIIKKVLTELGLSSEYKYRNLMYYDWIELEVEYTDTIMYQLWERGRCGDSDQRLGSYRLSQHIIDGHPEKFEAEIRAQYEAESKKKLQSDAEEKQRKIAQLQNELMKLQGEPK